ncbi:TPM domain-containing protein [Streptomyces qinzhouensis]|uniref:TPM domain-containing protein n=1 Tax=Streptomyces qinzhouensis TaxID=2599401 RepID=A0A5B8JBT7_9ACTN|nr:TPM domain-containing protein [Streptomyces qinzhouensis]QDY78846.1 TPM domain-containing protein [Streptomyces qinzhouensis]
MTRISARLTLAALLAAAWLSPPLAPSATAAHRPAARSTAAGPGRPAPPAEDPVTLSRDGQITDRAGALGDRRAEVTRALDRLYAAERLQLFVVYVRDFSGRTAQEWADATARRNGLGTDDLLLAVATHDRQYAYWAAAASPLTDARLAEVARTAIVPPLRAHDWAGAAVGAADGYAAVLAGRPVPSPTIVPGDPDPGTAPAGTGAGDLVLPVGVAIAVVGVAAYAATRRRHRTATRTTPQGGRAGWSSGPDAAAGPPTAELDARARQALVGTDDALRTSQEELGFATAQFGEAAAEPFTAAVAYAQGELTAAFRLRQQLDDAHPEDEATRRRMLEEILARCADADRRLDAESEDFDRLRDLERNAPEALRTADERFAELNGRLLSTDAALAVMRERYAPSASAPVMSDATAAGDRLVFAKTAADRARTALAADENATAAVQIRATEGALAQADRLIEAVDRRARELAEAVGALPGALTETDSDLAEAHGVLDGTAPEESTAGLRGRTARAESVAAEVRREMAAGPYDPIDALRRVEEADAALDAALAGARAGEESARRARSLLGQATLGARAAVEAAADYITTHRGAVGSPARTRLAEAQRRLALSAEQAAEAPGTGGAGGGGQANVQAALGEAQRADALAREAQRLAEEDVRGFGNPFGAGGVSGAGSAGGGLGGAVLGGILLGGLFGGGRGGGHGSGGGFGSGGFGGRPGSFGGGGTRGRMGGGRF